MRDSSSIFIGCQNNCTSAIYTLDDGLSWSSAPNDFRHFDFNGDSTTAANSDWIYAFDQKNGTWQKTHRAIDDGYTGQYQLFGDTVICLKNGKLSINDGQNVLTPRVGVGSHKDFRFFDAYHGFVTTKDSIYWTDDAGVSFKGVGELSSQDYAFPFPRAVVQRQFPDTIMVTIDTGKTWRSKYAPLTSFQFMSSTNSVVLTDHSGTAILFNPETLVFKDLLHRETIKDIWAIGQLDANNYYLHCDNDTSYRLNLKKEALNPVYIGHLEFYENLKFGGFNGNSGFVYTSGKAFVTKDGGQQWNALQGTPSFSHVHWSTPTHLLGASSIWGDDSVKFYRSLNEGQKWEVVHKEEVTWPLTNLMSFNGNAFLADVDRWLCYYETRPDSTYKIKIRPTGIRTHLSKINDSTAVLLDYSFGNSFTQDRGKTWQSLPEYGYAPFENYILRTTVDGKILIYNAAKSSISYCRLGDNSFTTEEVGVPDIYDLQIVNDSTLMMVGSSGKIITYQAGEEFRNHSTMPTMVNDTNQVAISSFINIYPNPAERYLELQFAKKYSGGSWSIISMAGEVLQSGKLPDDTHHEIDLAKLQRGLYLLICTKGGQQEVLRFNKY